MELSLPASKPTAATPTTMQQQQPSIVRSLNLLDPILRFLTRATGQTLVPFENLQNTIKLSQVVPFDDIRRLVVFGILRVEVVGGGVSVEDFEEGVEDQDQHDSQYQDQHGDGEALNHRSSSWEEVLKQHWKGGISASLSSSSKDASASSTINETTPQSTTNTMPTPMRKKIFAGFPSGDANKKLCGSTKTAAKRRLAALKRCLKEEEKARKLLQEAKPKSKMKTKTRAKPLDRDSNNHKDAAAPSVSLLDEPTTSVMATNTRKDWTLPSATDTDNNSNDNNDQEEPLLKVEKQARKAVWDVLGLGLVRDDTDTTTTGNNNSNNNSGAATMKTKGKKKNSNNYNNNHKYDIYAPPAEEKSSSLSSSLFGPTPITNSVLPRQLSYAGTQPAQTAEYEQEHGTDDNDNDNATVSVNILLHPIIKEVFNLADTDADIRGAGGEATETKVNTTTNNDNTTTTNATKEQHKQTDEQFKIQKQRRRRLYKHQASAIVSALNEDKHTLVCTGTGSGKSLCFLIPVLQRAILTGQTSLLLFPTKALAQDQLVKLQSLLQEHPELAKCVFAAALDGDTPHSQRALIAETCNVVFTNPDTLHASILPHWETKYRTLLQNLKYVVIDEAHTYEGVFGAHVAMILARLYRVHCCCCKNNIHDNDDSDSDRDSDNDNDKEQYAQDNRPKPTIIDGNDATTSRGNNNNNSNSALNPPPSSSTSTSASLVFLACSATLAYPEHHFRLLCCIPSAQPVTVLTDDFSPRAAKHFFVWNPPLLDENGKSLGYVAWPNKAKAKTYSKQKGASTGKKRKSSSSSSAQKDPTKSTSTRGDNGKQPNDGSVIQLSSQSSEIEKSNIQRSRKEVRRRHSADETALLLARAVTKGVRCIAFCKTRCLVEWVYERCIRALKQSPETAKLISKVDSYRGGYSRLKRREIEEKLFHNQLLGVVGTSALELGVDIGGVGLTLHCGFPSSHASLMQQAGRAGRGAAASHQPSLAICVCFNSPIDQHLWRHPTSLLSRGLSAPLSMPIYPGLVQGHLICAGNEFPLTGRFNTSAIQTVEEKPVDDLLSDEELFGSKKVYLEAMESLMSNGSFSMEKIAVFGGKFIAVFKTHPSIKNPWTEVSIRSIETVNYDIVDLSHPMQGNRMDGKHHEAAIMDNIPYSRVFYHAFPGAIITHRGRRYKIVSMTRPPAFGVGFRSTVTLGAYAKPSSHRYCTRPLSNLKITVVKQMERVDLTDKGTSQKELNQAPPDPSTIFSDDLDPSLGSFAGCGIITVKRNVHGYKKISLVTRDELSRSELSLPDMEYDTFAFWIDCDASGLGRLMTQQAFGYGVHALSHALCNVAPLFVPCVLNDVQCDHSFYSPTRVVIFDSRAGGSGITAQLWKSIFTPRGLVQAAVDLLQTCPSCADDAGYTGGCPACIQAGECIKFNDFLCKSSALIIARHMLQRLEKTELYKQKVKEQLNEEFGDGVHSQLDSNVSRDELKKKKERDSFSSPRSEKRRKAMRVAMDIDTARQRQLVIGRPSWPMDRSSGTPREQQEA